NPPGDLPPPSLRTPKVGPGTCGPTVRGDAYEATSVHHRCPPGDALDDAAARASACRHDPGTCHGRREPATALRGHGRSREPRRTDPGGRSLPQIGRASCREGV